jgi:hypothetical protein
MTTPNPSNVALSAAQELRDLVDRWYVEVISLPSLEADEALVRAARLEADIMLARTKAMRAQVRAVAWFRGRLIPCWRPYGAKRPYCSGQATFGVPDTRDKDWFRTSQARGMNSIGRHR